MTELILSLGSNQGDRYHYLQSAVSYVSDALAVSDVRVSSFVETAAWGGVSQAPFLNAVMVCDTLLLPRKCLAITLAIEKRMGRKTFYGDKVICDDDFIVPHPLLHHRLFVLESLSEVLPDFVHPVLNDTSKMLLSHKKEGVYAC